MAGIFQSDLILATSIRAGLADMRKNLFIIDDMMKDLTTDPLLKKLYGEKEVQKMKDFLSREIFVNLEHKQPDQAKFPNVTISIGGGQEDPRQSLSDGYDSGATLAMPLSKTKGAISDNPRIILGPVSAQSYDSMTGQITFPPSADLSNVFEDMYVYDSKNNKFFQISLVLNQSELLIQPGSQLDTNALYVYPTAQVVQNTMRSLKIWENHTIHLFATSATEVIYLYNIILYLLERYKKPLFDARGFAISIVGYSEIYFASPLGEADPNILYGRDISLRGYVEHTVIETTNLPLDGFNVELDVVSEAPPAAIQQQTEEQGWTTVNNTDNSNS